MKPFPSFFVLLCGIGILLGGMTYKSVGFAHNGDETPNLPENTSFSLNVRLSSRTIHPPKELIKEVISLKGIRAARPRVGPPPQAAIIEDDQRRRIVILSIEETGLIMAYVLEDLDLKPHLSEIALCAQEHHCGEDRMALTGGLGCIAICVKNVLDKIIQP
ncbi:MAG: hypothetical protein JSU59_01840 [Nitrospirota bacterium]|nr:MAG: hypothetical protein JSU59_01840 [Nitrospirota bacterium]